MPITHGIVHAGFRGFRRFVARKECRCKLIGNRTQSLTGHTAAVVRHTRKKKTMSIEVYIGSIKLDIFKKTTKTFV